MTSSTWDKGVLDPQWRRIVIKEPLPAKDFLDKYFPEKNTAKIIIHNRRDPNGGFPRDNIGGDIDLSDYKELTEFFFDGGLSSTQIKSIKLDGCPKLEEVTIVGWLNAKPALSLDIFKNLTTLKRLTIANGDQVNFSGSLKSLENLKNLDRLTIINTAGQKLAMEAIKEGMEFLPENLSYFNCNGTKFREELEIYQTGVNKPGVRKSIEPNFYLINAWKAVNNKNTGKFKHNIQHLESLIESIKKEEVTTKSELIPFLESVIKRKMKEELDRMGWY